MIIYQYIKNDAHENKNNDADNIRIGPHLWVQWLSLGKTKQTTAVSNSMLTFSLSLLNLESEMHNDWSPCVFIQQDIVVYFSSVRWIRWNNSACIDFRYFLTTTPRQWIHLHALCPVLWFQTTGDSTSRASVSTTVL